MTRSRRMRAFERDGWILEPGVGARVWLPYQTPFRRASAGVIEQMLLGGFVSVRYRHGPYERVATVHRDDTRPADGQGTGCRLQATGGNEHGS